MNKEFVSYEQGLALKELGFDESCVMYWRPEMDGSMHLWHHDDAYFWDATGSNNSDNAKWVTCTAPLYQQAFRWFREKYKLIAYPQWRIDNTWDITIQQLDGYGLLSGQTTLSVIKKSTYEEAESACLDKLIQLLKDGK